MYTEQMFQSSNNCQHSAFLPQDAA